MTTMWSEKLIFSNVSIFAILMVFSNDNEERAKSLIYSANESVMA